MGDSGVIDGCTRVTLKCKKKSEDPSVGPGSDTVMGLKVLQKTFTPYLEVILETIIRNLVLFLMGSFTNNLIDLTDNVPCACNKVYDAIKSVYVLCRWRVGPQDPLLWWAQVTSVQHQPFSMND